MPQKLHNNIDLYMQNPTARSHFKKTLLCDIARSPSSQSTQSQGVGGQLNTIDRSDSFSHVDFSLFDVQEDVEDDVANPMRYSCELPTDAV